jgi:hypothetical protein
MKTRFKRNDQQQMPKSPWAQMLFALHVPIEFRNPMDCNNGHHPTLPANGAGHKLQQFVAAHGGTLVSDERKNALWHDLAVKLANRWTSYETARGGDFSLVHLTDRHRRRAYDALVFWDLLVLNLNKTKLAHLMTEIETEKRALDESNDNPL